MSTSTPGYAIAAVLVGVAGVSLAALADDRYGSRAVADAVRGRSLVPGLDRWSNDRDLDHGYAPWTSMDLQGASLVLSWRDPSTGFLYWTLEDAGPSMPLYVEGILLGRFRGEARLLAAVEKTRKSPPLAMRATYDARLAAYRDDARGDDVEQGGYRDRSGSRAWKDLPDYYRKMSSQELRRLAAEGDALASETYDEKKLAFDAYRQRLARQQGKAK